MMMGEIERHEIYLNGMCEIKGHNQMVDQCFLTHGPLSADSALLDLLNF